MTLARPKIPKVFFIFSQFEGRVPSTLQMPSTNHKPTIHWTLTLGPAASEPTTTHQSPAATHAVY